MATRLVPVGLAGLLLVAQKGESDFGNIIWFVVVGAVIGLIARLIVPGTGGMGFLLTIIVGIIGALLPPATEQFPHHYGLADYAVTVTGGQILNNMLAAA